MQNISTFGRKAKCVANYAFRPQQGFVDHRTTFSCQSFGGLNLLKEGSTQIEQQTSKQKTSKLNDSQPFILRRNIQADQIVHSGTLNR